MSEQQQQQQPADTANKDPVVPTNFTVEGLVL
jgi:hypothetical protein